MIGRTIGPYEVVAKLGEGGMGEVYRARDTKLNRDVAIKVLPALFATDPERLARFTREAQTLAALNHPNIAHIHGVEESADVKALVMELVEGEDLSALIARGPMPIPDALPVARQIAEALEAAHEQGIVHRDLKPANIKVRADGTVKVLDFGLAKAIDPSGVSSNPAHSPTFTTAGTQVGMILGTAAYMSPEQAKGKSVDRRADIWAFGVVFYEMLTGTHPFSGESIAETLGLIVTREPDLAALPPGTPDGIRALISRCLVKDARQRLRDMGDARLQIEEALTGRPAPAQRTSDIAPVVLIARRPSWQLGIALVVMAAAGAALGWWAKPSPPAPLVRLSIALPPGEQVTTPPAISRDGRLIAYAAGRTPATSRLFLRALDDVTPRAVDSGASATYPFFSPDGRSIAFFAAGKLRRAPVAGGGSTGLAPAASAWGGTWGRDGYITYVPNLNAGLWRVPEAGGTPEQLTKPDAAGSGYAHVFPERLPTGDVVFNFWGQTFYLALQPADGGPWRAITPERSATNVVSGPYATTGYLLSGDGVAGISAASWTPAVTTPVSIETRVLDDVYWISGTERSWIDVSANGTVVSVPGSAARRRLVWVDRSGAVTELPGEVDQIHDATISRDGRRVVHTGKNSLWVVDHTTGARTRIMSELKAFCGGWLPGDDRVVVSSNKTGNWDLYTVAANGAGELKPLLERPFTQHPIAVAPAGAVAYSENHPVTGRDLWILLPDGRTTPLAVSPFSEAAANFSADGRYVAYTSDESGRNEVYAISASGKGERTMISINGGTGPVWSHDGRELFYRAGDDLVSVQVQTKGALVVGERRKLLDLSAFESAYFHEFDVSADGQRFLLIRAEPGARPTRLDVILNWFPELTRLAGR